MPDTETAAPIVCTECGDPATTSAYGEPFCGGCLCPTCEHVHSLDDRCPAVEAEAYDQER